MLKDDFGDDSGSGWDETAQCQSSHVVGEDLTRCGHGRWGGWGVYKADVSAAVYLFGVSATMVENGGLGGVGTGVPVPTPGLWGVV